MKQTILMNLMRNNMIKLTCKIYYNKGKIALVFSYICSLENKLIKKISDAKLKEATNQVKSN